MSGLDDLADRLAIQAAAESRPQLRSDLAAAAKIVRDYAALRSAADRLGTPTGQALARLLCPGGLIE